MAYNDIFGENSADYWSEEGCNKRMQKYNKISKGLKIFEYVLCFILISYFIVLALQSLSLLQTDFNVCGKIVCNSYNLVFLSMISKFIYYISCYLMVVILYEYFFGEFTLKSIYKYCLLFLGLYPSMILITINFDIYSTRLLTIFLTILYIFVTFFLRVFRSRLDFLYDVSNGKFSSKSNEEVTVVEKVNNKKKNYKEKKRRK